MIAGLGFSFEHHNGALWCQRIGYRSAGNASAYDKNITPYYIAHLCQPLSSLSGGKTDAIPVTTQDVSRYEPRALTPKLTLTLTLKMPVRVNAEPVF